MVSNFNNLDITIHDNTIQTLCLTGLAFLLKLVEFVVELDAILTFVMHLAILTSSVFAIISGFYALRDRYRNKKSV